MANTSTDYSYFDQFDDVTIDLTPYFDAINLGSTYQYSFTTIQPVLTTLKNIFQEVDIINTFISNIALFTQYQIQEKDTPEGVSLATYGTMDYWWIIAIFNNMKNMINDWLMSEDQMQALTAKLVMNDGKYSSTVYYNLLVERNEANRNILLPLPANIATIITAFRTAVTG
jgi:hypothetical protein